LFFAKPNKKVPSGPDTGYVGIVFGGIKLPPGPKGRLVFFILPRRSPIDLWNNDEHDRVG